MFLLKYILFLNGINSSSYKKKVIIFLKCKKSIQNDNFGYDLII